MLDMIENSMYKYLDIAEESIRNDSGGVNGGVKTRLLDCIRKFPELNAQQLADKLGVSKRTVERHISELRSEGKLIRIGPSKKGHWEIVDDDPK